MEENSQIIESQIAYYRARASEYDEWFLRQGRYDRGEAQRNQWFLEVAQVERALQEAKPTGKILELACGTGLWTHHLVSRAELLTAVDASPEVLQLNQQRLNSAKIEYVKANLFNWRPTQKYDFIFFGFWLSHVPASQFAPFWQLVHDALATDGKVFFIDSLLQQDSTAIDHREIDKSGISERKLNDGRVFNIVKLFYDPDLLQNKLWPIGWRGDIQQTDNYFVYGILHRI